MKYIGIFFTSLLIVAYTVLMNGWALATLWRWFMVSAFHLPLLTIPAAIGVSLVVTYMTHQHSKTKTDDDSWGQTMLKGFLIGTFKPLFALAFGWVIVRFL